ncbi:MAG: hypothetical protein AAF985_10890 [Bacteroidota bacterium]
MMPVDIYRSMYEIEKSIFKEFAVEPPANIHTLSFNLNEPLLSLAKIYVSDIISFQISNCDQLANLLFPHKIIIEDNTLGKSNTFDFFFNNQINEHLLDLPRYIGEKQEIEKRLMRFREELFHQNLFDESCEIVDPSIEELDTKSTGNGQINRTFHYNSEQAYKRNKLRLDDLATNYTISVSAKITDRDGIAINDARAKECYGWLLEKLFVFALHTKRSEILLNKLKKQALKSTIAVIMARNMSHTDGSHQMINFGNYVCNLDIVQLPDFKKSFERYNNHLRNVMELVADVSGGIGSQSLFSVDFCQFLEDLQINYFSSFLKKGKRNILRSNFLGSGLNDGKAHSILTLSNKLTNHLKIAFPGGENGATAFLIILKNIFRNLYKHSKPKFKEIYQDNVLKRQAYFNLELDLDDDLDKDYYSIRVVEKTNSYTAEEANSVLQCMGRHFDERIIGSYNQIKYDGWGLLEMKICAAYLIGASLHEIEFIEPKNKFYVLNRRKIPSDWITVHKTPDPSRNGKYQLIHRFYILREKFCTIWIKQEDLPIWRKHQHYLNRNGLFFKVRGKDTLQLNTHSKFVILGIDRHTPKHLNLRNVNVHCTNQLFNFIQCKSVKKIKHWIYKTWLNKFLQSIPYELRIEQWMNVDKGSRIDDQKRMVIFDNHNHHFKEKIETLSSKEVLFYYKKIGYYEQLNASIANQKIAETKVGDDVFHWELLEAINTRIAIFDERIQDFLCSKKKSFGATTSISLADLYALKNIFIPTENIYSDVDSNQYLDLDQFFYPRDNTSSGQDLSLATIHDLIAYLNYYFDIQHCHYIIVHFSGFEALVNRSQSLIRQLRTAYSPEANALNLAYQFVLSECDIDHAERYLVFTSGKGIPTTLPEECFFIAYNNIEMVLKKKTKSDLVKMLTSIRLTHTKM